MAMAAASDEEEKLIGSRLVEFDPNPVAVASIAQVHRGKWRQDENDQFLHDVAIKILRPKVVDQVATDLCVLLRAGDLLQEWAPRIVPASCIDWRLLLLYSYTPSVSPLKGESVKQQNLVCLNKSLLLRIF